MKKAGNRVITVLAAREKDLIILEEQMREHSDEVVIMTDSGDDISLPFDEIFEARLQVDWNHIMQKQKGKSRP